MKTVVLMIFTSILILHVSIAYAVPEPEYDTAFSYSEIVVIGKIMSVDILSEPIVMNTEGSFSEISGIAIYDVLVEESLKNPDGVERISVAGYFLREPHGMSYHTFPYESGHVALLYLQENTHGDGDTELIIRSSTSKTLDDYLHPNKFYYKFTDFQHANIVGQPIKFVLERIGHHDCYPYDVEITDEDGNFVTAFGAEPLCLPNKNSISVSSKIHIGHHEDHQIIIEESGKYFIKVNVDDIIIEKEFVVRHNSSGITLDRTYYPISSEIPPLKQTKLGIPVDEIQCRDSMVLMSKDEKHPACVTQPTAQKLSDRGWFWVLNIVPWNDTVNKPGDHKINCDNQTDPYQEFQCFKDAHSNCNVATVNPEIYTIEGDPIYTTLTITSDCKIQGVADMSTDRFWGEPEIIITQCEALMVDEYVWSAINCDAKQLPEMQFNFEMQLHPKILECEKNGDTWIREKLECIKEK